MIFQDFDQRTKKLLLLFLSLLLCWWLFFAPGTCSASGTQIPVPEEKTYTITETQLRGLEQRLTLLDQVLAQQNPELTTLQLQLTESRRELATLRNELSISKEADEGRRLIAECQSILREVRSRGKENPVKN